MNNEWKLISLSSLVVPIGMVVVVGTVIWSAGQWSAEMSSLITLQETAYDGLREEIARVSDRLDARLDVMDDQLRRNLKSQLTIDQAKLQAYREAIENPGHRVPMPDNPDHVITVERGSVTGRTN